MPRRSGRAAVVFADDEEQAKNAILLDALEEQAPGIDAAAAVEKALAADGNSQLPSDSAQFYVFATGPLYEVVRTMAGDDAADAIMSDVARIWERMSDCQRELDASVSLRGDELKGLSILVVDDDPMALRAVKRLLSGFGAEIQTAQNADEALVSSRRTAFDVILADYEMPGESGATLASSLPLALGSQAPPVVCLTGVTPAPRATAFSAVLTKPAHPGPLVRALLEAMAERSS